MSIQLDTKGSSAIQTYAKILFAEVSNNDQSIESFCRVQGMTRTEYDSAFLNGHGGGIDEFMNYLSSPQSDAMAPAHEDATHPICDYFVSTSHNTYLWGNQLYGKSSADAYQKVLERGARSVEIDVWDPDSDSDSEEGSGVSKLTEKFKKKVSLLKSKAKKNHKPQPIADGSTSTKESRSFSCEPRVLHGHTATKEVPFRTVCETIGRYAFEKCDLPIVVSLEVHTSHVQQRKMVEIMKECWAPYLNLDLEIDDDTPLPLLESLRKQILIKVKYTAPEKASKERTSETAKTEEDSSDEEEHDEAAHKSKIIPELGSLGLYTRSYHFKSFDQPEAKLPTHVFSLSEKKVLATHSREAAALFRHNKNYLMRAYPQALRIDSTNLDPAPFWRQGVQMVALNWQHCNASMMLNHAMFHGTGGWALKPEGYCSRHHATSQDAAIDRGGLDLSIELLAGHNIGPNGKHLKLYVRCELHIEDSQDETKMDDDSRDKEGQIKTHSEVARGGNNPDFQRQFLRFQGVPDVAEELTFVRFKIMDDETISRDEMMAWACFKLSRLQQGIRLIHLYDPEGLPTDGILLVRISKSVRRSA